MVDQDLVRYIAQSVATARLLRWGYDKTMDDRLASGWVDDEAQSGNLLEDVRVVLERLAAEGLLLPSGGSVYAEYGLEQSVPGSEGILMIGRGNRAQTAATHRRQVTVWPDDGPNDYWARYTTPWEKIDVPLAD